MWPRAKQELIAAQGDLELAWAALREAMGAPDLKATELKPIEPHTFPQGALEEEMATAAKTRPDLMALGQAQSAQASAVGAAKSDFGPRVSAYGNWEEDRDIVCRLGRQQLGGRRSDQRGHSAYWQARATGAGERGKTEDRCASGRHAAASAARSEPGAHSPADCGTALETAQAAMDQSAESLRILKNRYGAGLATITDLLRAEDAERQSQSNYWHAVYGNAMAYSELLYATGTLTPDAAEELQ